MMMMPPGDFGELGRDVFGLGVVAHVDVPF
jgi:hypothetical protein